MRWHAFYITKWQERPIIWNRERDLLYGTCICVYVPISLNGSRDLLYGTERERPIIWNLLYGDLIQWRKRMGPAQVTSKKRKKETYYMEPTLWRPISYGERERDQSRTLLKKRKKINLLYGTCYTETYYIWRKRKGTVPVTLKKRGKKETYYMEPVLWRPITVPKEKGTSPVCKHERERERFIRSPRTYSLLSLQKRETKKKETSSRAVTMIFLFFLFFFPAQFDAL